MVIDVSILINNIESFRQKHGHLTFDKTQITKFCYENKEFIAFSNGTAIINLDNFGKPIGCTSFWRLDQSYCLSSLVPKSSIIDKFLLKIYVDFNQVLRIIKIKACFLVIAVNRQTL